MEFQSDTKNVFTEATETEVEIKKSIGLHGFMIAYLKLNLSILFAVCTTYQDKPVPQKLYSIALQSEALLLNLLNP